MVSCVMQYGGIDLYRRLWCNKKRHCKLERFYEICRCERKRDSGKHADEREADTGENADVRWGDFRKRTFVRETDSGKHADVRWRILGKIQV